MTRCVLPSGIGPALTRRHLLAGLGGSLLLGNAASRAIETPAVRLGMLRFGTAEWEYQIAHDRHFDSAAGVTIDAVEFATGDAAQTALLAGRVDIILQDWLWVSRQRDAGADFTFRPLSSSLGALITAKDSGITSVADLKTRRLGVAGTPLDKSWILLRAYAQQKYGLDLVHDTTPHFAPPPLLEHALQAGQLDAILTFWPFAAKAEAEGLKTVITLDQVLAELGFTDPVPFVGYVFSQAWATQNSTALSGFLTATDRARHVLDTDDAAWGSLQKISGAKDAAQLASLRDWYRRGHAAAWDQADIAAAGRVYHLLSKIGGPGLVGKSTGIAPGTFWLKAA